MTRAVTLAEALRIKNELVSDVLTLRERLKEAFTYTVSPDGTTERAYEAGDWNSMMLELGKKTARLTEVKVKIADANQRRESPNSRSVQEIVVENGELKAMLKFYEELRPSKTPHNYFTAREDSRQRHTIMSMSELDEHVDELRFKIRENETRLARLNSYTQVELTF